MFQLSPEIWTQKEIEGTNSSRFSKVGKQQPSPEDFWLGLIETHRGAEGYGRMGVDCKLAGLGGGSSETWVFGDGLLFRADGRYARPFLNVQVAQQTARHTQPQQEP